MSKIKNGGLDQYGKVLSLNGIGSERIRHWCWGWWKMKDNQDDLHWSGLTTSWCGVIKTSKQQWQWRRTETTGEESCLASCCYSPRDYGIRRRIKPKSVFMPTSNAPIYSYRYCVRCFHLYFSCHYRLLFDVHAYTFDMCINESYLLTYLLTIFCVFNFRTNCNLSLSCAALTTRYYTIARPSVTFWCDIMRMWTITSTRAQSLRRRTVLTTSFDMLHPSVTYAYYRFSVMELIRHTDDSRNFRIGLICRRSCYGTLRDPWVTRCQSGTWLPNVVA